MPVEARFGRRLRLGGASRRSTTSSRAGRGGPSTTANCRVLCDVHNGKPHARSTATPTWTSSPAEYPTPPSRWRSGARGHRQVPVTFYVFPYGVTLSGPLPPFTQEAFEPPTRNGERHDDPDPELDSLQRLEVPRLEGRSSWSPPSPSSSAPSSPRSPRLRSTPPAPLPMAAVSATVSRTVSEFRRTAPRGAMRPPRRPPGWPFSCRVAIGSRARGATGSPLRRL